MINKTMRWQTCIGKTSSMGVCPVKPHDGVRAMRGGDGSLVFWYEDKTVKWVASTEGLQSVTWPKCPTLKDAFQGQGRYYQFNSNDSVLAKIDGIVYEWWAPDGGPDYPVKGMILDVHVCPSAGGTYFLAGETCPCNRCIVCDGFAPDSYFCSSACEDSAR